jgi:hypothetical protein
MKGPRERQTFEVRDRPSGVERSSGQGKANAVRIAYH